MDLQEPDSKNKRHALREYQASLLPFVVAKNGEVPKFLPIYRGLHICSENFVRRFKKEFAKNSTDLAIAFESGQLAHNIHLGEAPTEAINLFNN